MPSQNWGNLLSELHVPHKQCLTDISNAFSASFTSICYLSRGFTVSPIKRACSALHPQALTECSLLDFGRSSIVEMLYLDLEDLKQSKPDQEKERKERRERESYSLHKEPIGCISPPSSSYLPPFYIM